MKTGRETCLFYYFLKKWEKVGKTGCGPIGKIEIKKAERSILWQTRENRNFINVPIITE